MATIRLSDDRWPIENTALHLRGRFLDERGQAVAPLTATWTLLNEAQAIVNGRANVGIDASTPTFEITLTGNDLRLADGEKRYVYIRYSYISAHAGSESEPLNGVGVIEFGVKRALPAPVVQGPR